MVRTVRYALKACAPLWLAAVVIMAAGGGVLSPIDAHSCAVCWGSSADGSTSHGTTWGILFLMAMPFTIAGSIGGWLLYRYRHPEGRNRAQRTDVPHQFTTREESAN
jgi:hypothetical protein